MATFTLTDLRNEVSKKYAPTVIENGDDEYILQNVMQMPEKKRRLVTELIEEIGADDKDNDEDKEGADEIDSQTATLRKIIIAAEKNDKGEELLELIGDNVAMLVELFNSWTEGTQLGEASQS